jgi:hypothetical protein
VKRLQTYQDFANLAAEMERIGAWGQAEAAWEKAASMARKKINKEWAEKRQEMSAHYVRFPTRRPEVRHG